MADRVIPRFERIPDDPMTRRELLRRAAGAGLIVLAGPAAIAACAASSSASPGGGGGASASPGVGASGSPGGGGGAPVTLTFVSYGGAYQDAQSKGWIDPYMKANSNVTIVQDQPVDYAKIQAMVQAGNVTWDVADVGNDFGLDRNADILEPIDCTVVPCADFPKQFVGTYRIADIIYGVVMAYRTDKFHSGSEPQGWADFFDLARFPGKRGLWKFASGGVFEFALVADGVDPKKLYPLDIERAIKKLDTIKDSIVWWDTGAQSAQLLADGEVTIGHSWNGRIYNIQQTKAPVAIQWNQAFQTADYLVVPKGGKHVAEAMKFIAYATSPENNAAVSYFIAYAPPNPKAIAKVDPTKKNDLATTYSDKALFFDDEWWDKNFKTVDQRFQEWLQA
jgi:putative spermidine/putrescine transport system substrate-binding protein